MSYLQRYPNGPHAWDARRRLAFLSAALEPPPTFAMIDYDLPPPPPDEMVFVDRPVFYFGDPGFDFAPPPPMFFLPPPPLDFVVLEPPFAPVGLFILPQPVFVPVPAYVAAPGLCRAAAEQHHLQQHPQHDRHQKHINVAPTPQEQYCCRCRHRSDRSGPQLSTSLKTKAAAIARARRRFPRIHWSIQTQKPRPSRSSRSTRRPRPPRRRHRRRRRRPNCQAGRSSSSNKNGHAAGERKPYRGHRRRKRRT